MASLFVSHSLHSLIAARDTTLTSNVAWSGIAKRDESEKHAVAGVVFWILVVANLFILVPLFLFLNYTLVKLYPLLAIVEADSPPEYELVTGKESNIPVVGKENAGSSSKDEIIPDNVEESSCSKLMSDETAGQPATPSKPVTSSLVTTVRLLRSSSSGIFRAYRWYFLYNGVCGLTAVILVQIPYLPAILAVIIAHLVATKIETAWTHAVLASRHNSSLYKKLPSYFTILKATAIPLAARAVISIVIQLLALLPFGKRTGSVDPMGVIPIFEKSRSFMALSMFLVTFFTLDTCLLVPVEVVLVRTRAALMSEDTNTIIQLDSSIRSQSTEDIGFMSWLHAWRTFSRASWIRIAKVNAKVIITIAAAEVVALSVIFAQTVVFSTIFEPARHH